MPNKTFVDIFRSLLQEIVFCRCLKRFFLNQVVTILEFAAIARYTLKMNTYIPSISEYI